MNDKNEIFKVLIIHDKSSSIIMDEFEPQILNILENIYKQRLDLFRNIDLVCNRTKPININLKLIFKIWDATIILTDYNNRLRKYLLFALSFLYLSHRRVGVFSNDLFTRLSFKYWIYLNYALIRRHFKLTILKICWNCSLFRAYFINLFSTKNSIAEMCNNNGHNKSYGILPYNFPPQKGGIATWMHNLCKINHGDSHVCYVHKQNELYAYAGDPNFSLYQIDTDINIPLGTMLSNQKILWNSILKRINHKKIINFHKDLYTIFKCVIGLNIYHFFYVSQMLVNVIQAGVHNQIYICGTVMPVGLCALILKIFTGIPFVVIAHGAEILKWKKLGKIWRICTNIYTKADHIIANSQYTKQLLIDSGFDSEKITIIHPGVDCGRFSEKKYPLKPRLKSDRIILVSVGHLVDRKGFDTIIKALPLIHNTYPNAEYWIVGNGPYKIRLLSLAKKYQIQKHLRLFENMSDTELTSMLPSCDIFLMPSRIIGDSVEGFGIVFIEANAAGLPVIGGNTGGIPDAIIDGVTGYLVDPENINEIADKVLTLLNFVALYKKIGEAGRHRAIEYFSWDKSTCLTKQLLRTIIKG